MGIDHNPSAAVIELRDTSKSYGAVQALRDGNPLGLWRRMDGALGQH